MGRSTKRWRISRSPEGELPRVEQVFVYDSAEAEAKAAILSDPIRTLNDRETDDRSSQFENLEPDPVNQNQ